jgi:hypothetical protein
MGDDPRPIPVCATHGPSLAQRGATFPAWPVIVLV